MASYRDLIEGMTILSRYSEKGMDTHVAGADHDVLWVGGAETEEEVSVEDRKRLDELGFHFDSECEAWSHFV